MILVWVNAILVSPISPNLHIIGSCENNSDLYMNYNANCSRFLYLVCYLYVRYFCCANKSVNSRHYLYHGQCDYQYQGNMKLSLTYLMYVTMYPTNSTLHLIQMLRVKTLGAPSF